MPNESNYYDITLPDGKIVSLPRVTSILRTINKEGLNIWRSKQGWEASEQYKEETADIGKEIHKLVAQLGRGKAIVPLEWELLSEEVRNGLRAYVRWQREHAFEPIDAEMLVYSLKYGFAGTVDAIGRFEGKHGLVLVDWKSGDTIWEEYVMQVAAYVTAWNELFRELPKPPKINRARIVSLSRNTGLPTQRIVERKELKRAFKAFLHAKGLFDYYKGVKHD